MLSFRIKKYLNIVIFIKVEKKERKRPTKVFEKNKKKTQIMCKRQKSVF